MRTWQIIVIVYCSITYILMLIAECDSYRTVRKGKDLCWAVCRVLLAPLYIVWRIFVLLFKTIRGYFEKLKVHGGYKRYQEWKRNEEIKKIERKQKREAESAEYNQITDAFKNGEIHRGELPRELNGITDFELYGNLFSDDWRELIYVENEYNDVINDFFKRNGKIELQHNMRVVYLPQCLKEITKDDILKYWNPGTSGGTIDKKGIDSSVLLNELCYPEDARQIKHGLMCCLRWEHNHGARYLHGCYYQIVAGSDEEIMSQIEIVADVVYNQMSTGILYYKDKSPAEGMGQNKDFADEQFSMEINTLIDEIRERVEALEQRGLSRNLLMRLLVNKRELSRMIITADLRVVLPDYNNMEINMEPINKAVFLLFLRHPEGIVFKNLPDYKNELAEIYKKIKPTWASDRILQSIEDVTNPCLNSINEKCARIRGAFIAQFDESLAHYYYINGNRGEAKKIALPRDLVIWE